MTQAFVNAMYRAMQMQAEQVLRDSAVSGPVTILRSADARYAGQGYELSVALPSGELGPEDMNVAEVHDALCGPGDLAAVDRLVAATPVCPVAELPLVV